MSTAELSFQSFEEALLAARRALRAGKLDVAEAIAGHVLSAGRDVASASLILARVALAQRTLDRAARHVEAAMAADAAAPELFDVRAALASAQGRHDQAAGILETYRASAPPQLELVRKLARAHMLANRPQAAVDVLTQALAHFPAEATLYDLLSETYFRGRRWVEATRFARASLRLDPANARRQLALLDAAARGYDYESIAVHCAPLCTALTRPGDVPLKRSLIVASDLRPMHATLFFESDALTRLAADHAAERLGSVGAPAVALARPRGGRIRIGYLSGDFHDHPVMQLMRGVFARHDVRRFDVHLFSYGSDDASRYRPELRARFPNFVDLEHADDGAAARAIAAAELDVLVDLKGWTRFTRMGILARRPAPVQIGFLGFPGTYGGGLADHLIVDRVVAPPESAAHYSETLLYLPHCYLPVDDSEPSPPKPPPRAAAGLPADAFVLCSFNRSLKVSRGNLLAWMDILRRAPRAVLWMSAASAGEREAVAAFARGAGVASNRIVFAERMPDKAAHLARLALADLALDTWRYNGHTSTIDALWAGVPVLAKRGTHFASRVSESSLRAAGLPDLVAADEAAYVTTAVDFATGARDIAPVRAAAADARRSAPLFDTAAFTRDFLALVAGTVR